MLLVVLVLPYLSPPPMLFFLPLRAKWNALVPVYAIGGIVPADCRVTERKRNKYYSALTY